MLLDLPNELHFAIAEGLPRKDLLALAGVCRQLNCIANDIIYEELHLSNTYPYLEATFKLLMAPDGHLAAKVKRAIFKTSKEEPDPTLQSEEKDPVCHTELWIPLDLLSCFSSLQSLELHGCPYHTEQAAIAEALRVGSPALRSLVYRPDGFLLFPEEDDTLEGSFPVRNLERLTWYTHIYFIHIQPQFYSVSKASLSSLTSISILGSSGVSLPRFRDGDSETTFTAFLTTIFPALTSLSLGPFSFLGGDDSRPMLSLFLRRHPRIVDLVLKITPVDERYDQEPWSFNRKMLPALRSLNTNFEILSELAEVKANGLRTLQKLTITDDYFKYWENLGTMWKFITPDKFPNVTAIAFNPGPDFSSRINKHFAWAIMQRIASTFPNARTWSSNVETDLWEGDNIIKYLSQFRHLEEVHMLREPAATIDAIRNHPDEQKLVSDSAVESVIAKFYKKMSFYKHCGPIYDPRYDTEQQSKSAHVSAYYLKHLAPSCPRISTFTAHSKGWVPDGMYA